MSFVFNTLTGLWTMDFGLWTVDSKVMQFKFSQFMTPTFLWSFHGGYPLRPPPDINFETQFKTFQFITSNIKQSVSYLCICNSTGMHSTLHIFFSFLDLQQIAVLTQNSIYRSSHLQATEAEILSNSLLVSFVCFCL